MLHSARPSLEHKPRGTTRVITIRQEAAGFGIRFGLTEAEDEIMQGPVFPTLEEALAWVDANDRDRDRSGG